MCYEITERDTPILYEAVAYMCGLAFKSLTSEVCVEYDMQITGNMFNDVREFVLMNAESIARKLYEGHDWLMDIVRESSQDENELRETAAGIYISLETPHRDPASIDDIELTATILVQAFNDCWDK